MELSTFRTGSLRSTGSAIAPGSLLVENLSSSVLHISYNLPAAGTAVVDESKEHRKYGVCFLVDDYNVVLLTSQPCALR